MEYLLLTGAVVGAVEFIRRMFEKDHEAAVIIFVAAFVGGLYGFLGIDATSVAEGIVVGLAASGLVTVASRV